MLARSRAIWTASAVIRPRADARLQSGRPIAGGHQGQRGQRRLRRAVHERAVSITGEEDAFDDRLAGGLGIHVGDVAEGRRQASVTRGGPGEGRGRVTQTGGIERTRLTDAHRDHDRPGATREGQRLAERTGEAALEEQRPIDADGRRDVARRRDGDADRLGVIGR